ncbi:GntR family transcriptional regulator [Pseudonocardia sp. HH130630-07]|uniref:GntR family transcriptional regulator n=1 Tax=Pseudonocardia sp. HH130630-07 TaxID=1690815 RepID=UPI000814FE3C|nr:GntR family transcriptional regulator [Pseudonocardia sp. HH130630-07]ANY09169.1 GntR family transcriptional regulator [Pseudonocardia sp. HH130630-07]
MKYLRLHDELRERVDAMAAGEPLPPERELAREVGVSRTTLRRAVDELVAAGRLHRRQGAGVFAVGPRIAHGLTATSFSADMRARGLEPGTRIVEFESGPAGPRLGRRLELSPDAPVVRAVRLRSAGGEPMALETLHVPGDLVPGLREPDLAESSYYELLARHGHAVAGGRQSIEPTVTDGAESALLGVPVHSPALLFERTTRDGGGRVLEFVRAVYRGDRYRIETEIAPVGVPAATR